MRRGAAIRALLTALLGAAALVLLGAALLPGAAVRLADRPGDPLTVRGSLHVHTVRSDGAGTMEDVAAAAARAGLQFVVVTDHGDGTREPDPPRYRSGVLIVDAVEISTTGGHYVALGLDRAPYRLAGEPRDVVDDVTRLGGFGIVTHPDSAKDDLRWKDWRVPFEGLEWLNADSEWRNEGLLGVARGLVTYWFRGPETIAAAFDRPDAPFAEWDTVAQYRRVIGTAGHDAHARLGLRGNWEPADGGMSLRLPGYETAFRAFAVRVRLAAPPTGDAARDAAALLDAIGAGHLYTAIDALAAPPAFEFRARSGSRTALAGDDLLVGDAAVLEAFVNGPPMVSLVLRRNGRVVAASDSGRLRFDHAASPGSAVYRVEARLPGGPGTPPIPWIVGNPIFIGPALPRVRQSPRVPAAIDTRTVFESGDAGAWHVEKDAASRAGVAAQRAAWGGEALALEYALGGGPPAGQYAALVAAVGQGTLPPFTRVAFRAAADREMRISVQLRAPAGGARWIRSVVLDREPRAVVVPFSELTGVDAAPPQIQLAAVDSLLFVVDTVNTVPGRRGSVWIDDVRFERAP